jgi:hypothetical protein
MTTMEAGRIPLPSRDELRSLIEQGAGMCVSIFLPIYQAEPEWQQNRIRLENLLRQAKEHLVARGLHGAAAQEFLAPAYQLIEDRPFWHQSDGLALFTGAEFFRVYRLPLVFEELVVVDERFHITPLLALPRGDDHFYVLALSLKQARLFHATPSGFIPVVLPGVPHGLADALKYDEFAKQHQLHPGVPGHGGERGAIFHGQGDRDEVIKEEILRYFQQINRGVQAALRNERAPLLLAGVAYLLAIYRQANTYSELLEEAILGSPDDLRPEELHTRAWPIVAPRFERDRIEAMARYQQLLGAQPALASSYLRAIVPAAHDGRIATLFVAAGQRRWGTFDPTTGVLILHEAAQPRDTELVDFAAIETILHSGAVYVVAPEQLTDAAPLAAIFRY